MKKILTILAWGFMIQGIMLCAHDARPSVAQTFCNPLSLSSGSLKYVRSLISGGLIGIGTGMVSAYFDTIAPHFWPITWFAAMNIRCDLVTSMEKDMVDQDIQFHDGLLRLSSLAAAWISWYKTYHHLNGVPPFAKN